MAVTGFWPVFKNLKATLDYADNPDKTTAPEYLDEDLYAALRYAENDDKTDRKMFVGGINCSAQNAYAEMIAVQRRFGLRGKVVGYHGIQSFREGEVTPEQAFVIGKKTARKMWGDRYQVLVTVHLNTDNVHCHFVVNPVSFKDGAKFKNKIGDHKELRKISDEICREHELSVLENSEFYSKGKKKEYWVHKAGKKTHRDYLREDVEYCLSFATSPREFESQLYALGYTLDPVRFSVKAKHWERAVRLNSMGFSKERVNAQLRQNAENRYRLFTLEYRPPYKPKKFPLEDELRKLGFSMLLADKTNADILKEKKHIESELQKCIVRSEQVAELCIKCYEDNVSGKLSDEMFMRFSGKYETERLELKEKISAYRKRLSEVDEMQLGKEKFIAAVRKFMQMDKLTAPLLRELIDRIDVYEVTGTGKNRKQMIKIHYKFVGYLELPSLARQHNYREETRKGVAVEYVPNALPA